MHDSIPYLDRLERQRERFDLDARAVGLDASYATAGIAKGLEDQEILGVTGYRRSPRPRPGMMRKKAFSFDLNSNGYRCPQGQFWPTQPLPDGLLPLQERPCHLPGLPAARLMHQQRQQSPLITRHVWQDARR